jgi:Protein of unknown function (DUF3040)
VRMLNEHEQRVLQDLEHRILADDPGFARRMTDRRTAPRGRAALRRLTSAPAVILLMAAAVGSFLAQVSAVGWLLMCCALAAGGVWLTRASRTDPWLAGPPSAPRRGAASADGGSERD